MSRWRALLAVAAVGVFVGGSYLSVYALNTFETPIGWDVPKYLWRTSLAAQVGVTGLPARVPPPVNASPDRPGFPLVALSLERLVPGTGAFDERLVLAAVLPIVGLVGLGLAAGALLVVGLGRPWWQGALGAAFVGTSSIAVRLAGPEAYVDNVLAGGVLLSAVVWLVARAAEAPDGVGPLPGGTLAPVALLVAGAAIHWAFFVVVWLSIGGALLWRRRGWFGPHAGGRGRVVLGALVLSLVGAAVVSLVVGAAPNPPVVHEGEFSRKLADTLQRLDLLLIPLALVGVLVAGRRRSLPGRPWETFTHDVLYVWLGASLVAVIVKLAGVPIPAHRLVAFALPLPVFAFLGAVGIGEAVASRIGPRGGAIGGRAGASVAVALLGASTVLALDTWTEIQPTMEPRKVADAAAVERYLDRAEVPPDRPVVFVVEDLGGNPDFTVPLMAHTFRTQLDPRRVGTTFVYVGDPETFLDRRVDVLRGDGTERRDGVAWRFMRDLRPVLGREPVAVVTEAYNAEHFASWARAHPDSVVEGTVAVVSGPAPAGTGEDPAADGDRAGNAPGRLGPVALAVAGAVAGAVLLAAGLAWTWTSALGRSRFAPIALGPAVGTAAVVLIGLLADVILGQPAAGAVTGPLAVAIGLGASVLWRNRRKAAS